VQISLYEHPVWQGIPEGVMRPGGLKITERALSHCNLQPGMHVLDLGCGSGVTLRHVTAKYGLIGFGVDASGELLSRAGRAHPHVGLARARSESLPIASESMDIVLSECTLSIFETDIAVSECARVLKNGGYFVVSDLFARDESGVEALRRLPSGSCISATIPQRQILEKTERCGLQVSVWQDCSESLKGFSICAIATAAQVDPFDLLIAAARAQLGYFFLVARKVRDGR
jgi:cyclopropane fatty-acyl-phospholipid synthase-like methyltransferase